MPYNAMKNRAFVPEEKFMREALSLAEEAFSAGEVLSLIHISEPTRPY